MKPWINWKLFNIEIGFKHKIINKMEDLTFGQKLVGVKFNPSGNEKVDKVKQLMAEVIDIVVEKDNINLDNYWSATNMNDFLKRLAVNELLTAQMAAVKYLTW